MNNLVFTFTGKAGCGKDTCAKFIREYLDELGISHFSLAYADYLKTLMKRNFGYSDENKEQFRGQLQEFGTEIVRTQDENFWVSTVFNTIDVLRKSYYVFLITDARFENELQPFPWNMGYPIFNVYVDREFESELTVSEQEHSSESMASNPDFEKFHFVINNNGTLDDLKADCRRMIDFVLSVKQAVETQSEEMLEQIMEEITE